jgi:hypothetical protein
MSMSHETDNTAKQSDLSSTSHGMYAVAVGRLSLSASGRDQYTEDKDEEAMESHPRHAENADRLTSVLCDLDSCLN